MVSSISQQTQSFAYEMAQVSASSSLQSSSKIERLNYNGLTESEKESLRQKYSSIVEEYNLDDIDFYDELVQSDEIDDDYLNLELEQSEENYNSSLVTEKEVSTSDEISYFASKYAEISDELAPQVASVNLNLSGYNKFNYNKINSAYAQKSTYIQSNVKVYA